MGGAISDWSADCPPLVRQEVFEICAISHMMNYLSQPLFRGGLQPGDDLDWDC